MRFLGREQPGVRTLLLLAALVLSFAAGQFVCCVFSIFALSAIQERTPPHMLGKIMAYTSTLSLCAQPLGQLIYGFLFDALAGEVYLVLLATGGLLCCIGLLSARFFRRLAE